MNIMLLRGEIVANYKTQKAFAKRIKWHENKVSSMLCDKYKPNVDEVESIAEALNLSEEQFCKIFLQRKSPNGKNDGRSQTMHEKLKE